MVDTPLLLTISQASATFVAILAGFYTTKVLSISNERKRLHSVTKAIDNEIRSRNQTVTQLTRQIDSIHNRWDEEWIESFVDYIRNAPVFISMNKIDTLGDIKQRFEDLYKQPPSENHLKILREKYPSLLKDIQKTKGMTFKLGPYTSEPEQLRKVLENTDETRMMTQLYERVNREKNQISFLEGLYLVLTFL